MEERLTKAEIKEQRKQERQAFEAKINQEAAKTKGKKIVFWAVGIIVCALAVWGLIMLVNAPAASSTPEISAPSLLSNDITMGPKNAKVKLVEYADFQCPACGAYHPLVKQLQQDFNGKVLFIYRFFPLTNIHPNAQISAEAAYAAYLQGKFWEMNDLLFSHQKDWVDQVDPMQTFVGYAKTIGLDTDKFQKDMQDKKTKQFIDDQENAGVNAGVNATPTFLINGKAIQNPTSYDDFKKLIQDALK